MGICRLVMGLWLAATAAHAVAQGNYPEQPVRILVGFTAGVAPDVKVIKQAGIKASD
jgi:hypothetical protein